jgi:hypothetical protein
MESYADGVEATELYLRHLQSLELGIEDYIAVSTIDSFLNEAEGEVKDPALGWPERRSTLLSLTGAIRSRPDRERRIREALKSEDRQTFWTATEAASVLGIDVWDVHFERLKRDEKSFWQVNTLKQINIEGCSRAGFIRHPLEPRIDRLALQRQNTEDALMNPSQRLALNKSF